MTTEVDTHDPAGIARWLRERAQAAHDFLALDSEEQQRQYLNKWQQMCCRIWRSDFGRPPSWLRNSRPSVSTCAARCRTCQLNGRQIALAEWTQNSGVMTRNVRFDTGTNAGRCKAN